MGAGSGSEQLPPDAEAHQSAYVVVAPHKFKGTASAVEVAAALTPAAWACRSFSARLPTAATARSMR